MSLTKRQAILWTIPATLWVLVCILNLFSPGRKYPAMLVVDFATAACFCALALIKFAQYRKERRTRAEEL